MNHFLVFSVFIGQQYITMPQNQICQKKTAPEVIGCCVIYQSVFLGQFLINAFISLKKKEASCARVNYARIA